MSPAEDREPRYTVSHSDGREVEVVRHLDRFTARRLVEHEENAGRTAFAVEEEEGRGNGRYR